MSQWFNSTSPTRMRTSSKASVQRKGAFIVATGSFSIFAIAGRTDLQRPYVFIIDEINRGNLSKVFGELMMLIEADKRGSEYAIPLTYAETAKILLSRFQRTSI